MHAHTFVLNPTRLSLHPFCGPKHLCASIQLIVLMSASLMLFLSCTRPIVTASNTKPGVTAGVITYLPNVPLRVNNIEGVSTAFA